MLLVTEHLKAAGLEKFRRFRPQLETGFSRDNWRHPALLEMTGAYAYVLSLPQIGEAKPGYISLDPCMDGMIDYYDTKLPENPKNLERRLEADGLHFYGDTLPQQGGIIAFFLKPPSSASSPSELLYLRRDHDGTWSYRMITEKTGCRNPHIPQQHDFSGHLIRNVRTADFGPFKTFLGFASIPYEGIFYQRRVIIPNEAIRPFCGTTPACIRLGMEPTPKA